MSRERKSGKKLHEVDAQTRAELVEATDDRMLDALSVGLLSDTDIFGQHVAVIKVERDTGESVRLYRPSEEARTSGYVPDLWVEFGAGSSEDGCFLEVWPNRDQLVAPVETDAGTIPEALPVSNTRVLVTRARNITFGGTLASPFLIAQ